MTLVTAIDVGVRNMAVCAFDFKTRKVVHWRCMPICTGKYMPSRNVNYVRSFLAMHSDLFERSNTILIERQMRCNMRIIEAALHIHFAEQGKVVHVLAPYAVKHHYGISTGSYSANKQQAILWANAFVDSNPEFILKSEKLNFMCKKRDDLADALLLLVYYLDTYSNQYDTEIRDDVA